MTHDELLTHIAIDGGSQKLKDALLAVVNLHKPQEITLPDGAWGTNCYECNGLQYPCQTIRAIEKELK
jgi:hypothetical protein